jgi:hypothetical protein
MSLAAVREAAEELMSDYAELIDADRLEEWLELFTEDAVYQVLPRENVEQNLPVSLMLCTNKNMLRDRVVSLRNANEYNLHYDRHLREGHRGYLLGAHLACDTSVSRDVSQTFKLRHVPLGCGPRRTRRPTMPVWTIKIFKCCWQRI